MINNTMVSEHKKLNTALYLRLSREDDGDNAESLSIKNQRLLLLDYVNKHDELSVYDMYVDDGWSGTNFDRPEFCRMITDIEEKKIQCVVVKDLSRLGRNMPKVTEYISDYFPSKKVRFIAINDNVDKEYDDFDINEDMMMDFKNLFNGFYPKDISKKVRSTFRTKQANGQFIGAFACYGYKKSEYDHNQLVIDEYAAGIVRRIFQMYIGGMGQNTIARVLNEEGIPCPSEYKKMSGLKYHNSNRLSGTSYWTYSTVRHILRNEMYIGTMVQNKSFRQMCKKKAISLPREKWIVVPNNHEAIIDRKTWNTAQELLKRNTRHVGLTNNIHMFAGFIKCGDCERAMVKLKRKNKIVFHCGSYNRYGKQFCSSHQISEEELEQIILDDLNVIVQSVKNVQQIIESEQKQQKAVQRDVQGDILEYQNQIARLEKKRERAYDDYLDDMITKQSYLKCKEDYEQQITMLQSKIDVLNQSMESRAVPTNPWIEKLLKQEELEHLDRETIVEMISMIYIYENNTIKIVYNFSDELEALLSAYEKVNEST